MKRLQICINIIIISNLLLIDFVQLLLKIINNIQRDIFKEHIWDKFYKLDRV